jgi:hypothetical protein
MALRLSPDKVDDAFERRRNEALLTLAFRSQQSIQDEVGSRPSRAMIRRAPAAGSRKKFIGWSGAVRRRCLYQLCALPTYRAKACSCSGEGVGTPASSSRYSARLSRSGACDGRLCNRRSCRLNDATASRSCQSSRTERTRPQRTQSKIVCPHGRTIEPRGARRAQHGLSGVRASISACRHP